VHNFKDLSTLEEVQIAIERDIIEVFKATLEVDPYTEAVYY
jgi:hypothetical protein